MVQYPLADPKNPSENRLKITSSGGNKKGSAAQLLQGLHVLVLQVHQHDVAALVPVIHELHARPDSWRAAEGAMAMAMPTPGHRLGLGFSGMITTPMG